MVGKTLGHYEILEPLGAGGMGEVYRAHDTTLKRDVAIKVLPEDLGDDPDRLARLEREAHLLAALNHSNVATIHGLEEAEGVRFLVLELVEGETLAERLHGGALEVEDALGIARQIAEGLEAAHTNGIIHRDLKPANIKISPAGRVKVLDFGLAKPTEGEGADGLETDDLTHSPTLTVAGTAAGVLLGTAPYMSPEQAKGRPVDKRADIWAFGCVLYEMLTGRRPFVGEDVSETIASILKVEPDWSLLPAGTPALTRSLLRRCLHKDPDRRLHDIADARIEIEEALSEPEADLRGVAPVAAQSPLWRRAIPWGAGIVVGAIVAGLAVWSVMRPTPQVKYLEVGVQSGTHLWGGSRSESDAWAFQRPSQTAMAFSPDGRHLVYSATDGEQSQLYLRAVDEERAVPIPDTEGGCCPFFSPDGQSIGFTSRDEAGRSLKSIPLSGGEARTIASEVPNPLGASWGDNDTIVFADGVEGGLLQVQAAGGTPEPLTEIDHEKGETSHRLPSFLPGGNAVLFTVVRGWYRWDEAEIAVLSLETGDRKVLIGAGADPRYVPTGHLIFFREGTLMGVPFDPVRLETAGEPVPVREDVMQACFIANPTLDTGAAQFSFSALGDLAYAPGGVYPEGRNPLVWVDRDREPEVIDTRPGEHWYPRISPDGQSLAYLRGRTGEGDLWVYDIERKTERRLTVQEGVGSLVWSPDSERIVFGSARNGSTYNLYSIAADGTGEISRLTTSNDDQYAASWSPEGVLAFVDGKDDVWVLPMEGDGANEPQLFLDSQAWEEYPNFAPDGKWLAYASNETGRFEVYVRPYPGPGAAIPVSTEGGRRPAWSRNGRELFYRETAGRMMVVDMDVTANGELDPGRPRQLFDGLYSATYPLRNYDVAEDGRFVMVLENELESQPVTHINIILNWFEELKRLVPTGR